MTMAPSTLAEYSMPSLGADMDEGTVIEWLVGVGDTLERGQVVARIETEKSDIDIEIWHDGVVAEIVVGPNATVPVGTTLMRFHGAGVAESNADPVAPDARVQDAVLASPLARRLAGEQGIALADVVGSGPQGAVRASDLSGSVAAANDEPDGEVAVLPADRTSRPDRMRSMIAARMTRSNHEIPHYRLERNIDLGRLVEYLSTINEQRPIAERVVPAAALVRAVAIAAARHPELNGTWSDDQFHPGPGVNVSVAISLRGGGLVTPTIRDADAASLDEVMALLREFTTAARSGTMRSEWTTAVSSMTVTNLGERGADLVHGLISPPEVALVGFGRIIERPVVVDGVVVARPVVTATLGADHRATDGAVGSRFLSTLSSALEEPECL
jgi:pyruvate dehydrogenase E2 component (dihydrolipoamide acetyltransferase)